MSFSSTPTTPSSEIVSATATITGPIHFSVTCMNDRCKMNVFGKPESKLMSMPSVVARPPPFGSLPLPGSGGGGKVRPYFPVNG